LKESESLKLKIRGIRALGAITNDNRKSQEMIHVHPEVIDLVLGCILKSNLLILQRIASSALASFVEGDSYTQQLVLKAGAADVIITVLQGTDEDAKSAICMMARPLTRNNVKVQNTLRKKNIFTTIIPTIPGKKDSYTTFALNFILELLRDNVVNQETFCLESGIPPIVTILKTSFSPTALYFSLGILFNIAKKNNKLRTTVKNAGVISLVNPLLRHENQLVKTGATELNKILEQTSSFRNLVSGLSTRSLKKS